LIAVDLPPARLLRTLMTIASQGQMLVAIAASLGFLFSGSQTVDPSRAGKHDTRAGAANGNGSPQVVVTSLDPLATTHAVVLSWKASVPASSAPGDAIKGYIVQRSLQFNGRSVPPIHTRVVPGTSCTDDLVENGRTYFYVVRGVAQNGRTSGPSNEAKVVIRKDAGPAPASNGPFRLCREAGKAHLDSSALKSSKRGSKRLFRCRG
jgi:hypothetical protein